MEYYLNQNLINQQEDPSFLQELAVEASSKTETTEVIQSINELLNKYWVGYPILVLSSFYFLFIFISIYCRHD
jgi:hypothetical protein